MFKKILIANRGEIAVRVINACREMDIGTVAVYSTIDRTSLHVRRADEAVCIGPPPPLESYLNIDAIIEATRKAGAEAIHPGYGFLAENHLFAARCEKEGIVFIGPTSASMKLVGNKIDSRNTMIKAKIPIIPGMQMKGGDIDDYRAQAKKIGYPVMLKAAAGGGGKGMRVVEDEAELESAVEAGSREAKTAFGDETVYLEKCIRNPRHVEFQVLADNHGHAIHLFERECSIQRRHQKIIEETPSVALDPELRRKMGEVAVKVVKETGYTNAGTCEFLLDEDKNFYFLEVNARIQVEHPVTELVTGIDLVKWQIRIAAGDRLTLQQDALKQTGHAIECRVYAEDPENKFLPSPGKILFMQEPSGPGVRHDCGVFAGAEVSVYYDPILSKIIVWGADRDTAIRRMKLALEQTVFLGIRTPVTYLRDVIVHDDFVQGRTDTGFIERNMKDWNPAPGEDAVEAAVISAALLSMGKKKKFAPSAEKAAFSPWQAIGRWEIGTGG
jgi:acetyl-CoA carboxylase biotin carboxylase subunit